MLHIGVYFFLPFSFLAGNQIWSQFRLRSLIAPDNYNQISRAHGNISSTQLSGAIKLLNRNCDQIWFPAKKEKGKKK
jgi:hypothetical protein